MRPVVLCGPLRKPLPALALALALASCSEPPDPTSAAPAGPEPTAGSGTIQIYYDESLDYEFLAKSLAESGVFEGMAAAVTSVVALPVDLEAVFTECGEENAFYFQGQIVMCYELFDRFVEVFLDIDDENLEWVYQGVFGSGAHVFLHEIGHALVDQLRIPITGREEDSVDTLAALILIHGGSQEELWAALQKFAVVAAANESEGWRPYWDEHSLAAQRYYDMACLIYGSDPEAWAGIVAPDMLPVERAERCVTEFWQKSFGWDQLLAPHYREAQSPSEALTWPLACAVFPPDGERLADCASRGLDGEIVLRPGVLVGGDEPNEIHAVIVDGELLFALASGRTAPAFFFDNGPDYFVEGLARTVRDGKMGFVNESLELVVAREWDFALPFEDGVARVCNGCSVVHDQGGEHGTLVGGAWGMIDRQGSLVVPVEYELESLPPAPSSD